MLVRSGYIYLGGLSTSRAPITSNESLENKQYFCLDLLAKREYILRPVDARSIILVIFDPFYTLSTFLSGIPLGALDDYWKKPTFFISDVFQTPS